MSVAGPLTPNLYRWILTYNNCLLGKSLAYFHKSAGPVFCTRRVCELESCFLSVACVCPAPPPPLPPGS